MPNIESLSREDMSVAYLQAICACDGYSLEVVKHDNYGVDCHVVCKGKADPSSLKNDSMIHVQLKSSGSQITVDSSGNLHYPLEKKNYESLRDADSFIPKILVLLHMNQLKSDWIDQNRDRLEIRKGAYWYSLKGMPANSNETSVTITVPSGNLLTPQALKDLMVKASKDLL